MIPMNRKWLNGCAVLSVMFIAPCLLIAAVSGYGFFTGGSPPPEGVQIEVYLPESVRSGGGRSELEIHINNQSPDIQVLDSIDLSNSVLDGLDVQSSVPSYTASDEYLDFQSYSFGRQIAPQERLVVVFNAVGKASGEYPGWIRVCINEAMSCLSFEGTVFIAN